MIPATPFGLPGGSAGKEFAHGEDTESWAIPGLGRPPGKGTGNLISVLAGRTLWTEGPATVPGGRKGPDTAEGSEHSRAHLLHWP